MTAAVEDDRMSAITRGSTPEARHATTSAVSCDAEVPHRNVATRRRACGVKFVVFLTMSIRSWII